MTKKTKMLTISLMILILLLIVAIFISKSAFGVANPFASFYGVCKISFTDAEYAEIQAKPKVIISKPESSFTKLLEYMNNQGYSKEDQMGALITFRNVETDDVVKIFYSSGGYFSEWKWQE